MRRAYFVPAENLEIYFKSWEEKWLKTERDINNPKIPMRFVIEHGELLYTDDVPLDLKKAAAIRAQRTKDAQNRKTSKEAAQKKLRRQIGSTKQ